ncbi:hypothetical protein HYU72_02300 [Candidatus Berkelbacteria bacterium]|nr:hypothetical protein [Candidatus Berkelbacteria bacterium]
MEKEREFQPSEEKESEKPDVEILENEVKKNWNWVIKTRDPDENFFTDKNGQRVERIDENTERFIRDEDGSLFLDMNNFHGYFGYKYEMALAADREGRDHERIKEIEDMHNIIKREKPVLLEEIFRKSEEREKVMNEIGGLISSWSESDFARADMAYEELYPYLLEAYVLLRKKGFSIRKLVA